MEKLFLVTNPGSSSRKYALYKNGQEVCSLHFETEDKKLICTLKHSDGRTQKFTNGFKRIADTIRYTYNILTETGYLSVDDTLDGILARVVATGEFFNNTSTIPATKSTSSTLSTSTSRIVPKSSAMAITVFLWALSATTSVITTFSPSASSLATSVLAPRSPRLKADTPTIRPWATPLSKAS